MSYLSPHVFHILCEIPKKSEKNLQQIKVCCGCIQLSQRNQQLFCLFPGSSTDKKKHLKNAEHIWIAQKAAEQYKSNRYKILLSLFHWTGATAEIVECISDSVLLTNLSILKLTVIIERALGDVFITVSKISKCPSLLKDLLKTEELKKTFGEVAVTILQTLMGPPISLNLRNVLWHGFPMLGEVPYLYCNFLTKMITKLGHILEEKQICIKHRPKLNMPSANLTSRSFPFLDTSHKDVLLKLFKSTAFIPLGMLPAWKLVLEMFFAERYSDAVILFLPQLEHALRCLFTVVNECPNRLLTAESDVLYTTFDEILAKETEDNKENKLLPEVGHNLTEMLYDILYFPEGPKLRDRLSHGEYDFKDVDVVIANHVICIGISFCLKYLFPWRRELIDSFKILRELDSTSRTYRSVYHPISLLRREIQSIVDQMEVFEKETQKIQDMTEEPKGKKSIDELQNVVQEYLQICEVSFRDCTIKEDCSVELIRNSIKILIKKNREVMHRPKGELEINGILRKIVKQCSLAIGQVLQSFKEKQMQWEQKILRSRARQNYLNMLSVLPLLTLLWSFMILIVSVESVISVTEKPKEAETQTIRYLKKCLKYAENVTTLCSPSNNKWLECINVTSLLTETAKRRLSNKSTKTLHHDISFS